MLDIPQGPPRCGPQKKRILKLAVIRLANDFGRLAQVPIWRAARRTSAAPLEGQSLFAQFNGGAGQAPPLTIERTYSKGFRNSSDAFQAKRPWSSL
jgi:hypothetical protein